MIWVVYFFSCFLFFGSLFWGRLIGVWLCIEAGGLVLIFGFFEKKAKANRYRALLNYLVISGISSGLLFSSRLSPALAWLALVSFGVKVGLFPFVGWVCGVLGEVSWGLLFLLGGVRKVYLLCIPSLGINGDFSGLASITLLVCGVLVWRDVSSLKGWVAYSRVASSAALYYFCVWGDQGAANSLFLVFLLSQAFSFLVLPGLESRRSRSLPFFILISLPISLGFIYKVWVAYLLVYALAPFVGVWVVFGVLEQSFIFVYLLEKIGLKEKLA